MFKGYGPGACWDGVGPARSRGDPVVVEVVPRVRVVPPSAPMYFGRTGEGCFNGKVWVVRLVSRNAPIHVEHRTNRRHTAKPTRRVTEAAQRVLSRRLFPLRC